MIILLSLAVLFQLIMILLLHDISEMLGYIADLFENSETFEGLSRTTYSGINVDYKGDKHIQFVDSVRPQEKINKIFNIKHE